MKVLGLGNALTDVLATLPTDGVISRTGLLKGGMQLIDEQKLAELTALFKGYDTVLAPGGSAANTLTGITRMGLPAGFIGKIGRDECGRFYREALEQAGVESRLLEGDLPSGRAMTLVSPDGERTFGTYLGAAASLTAAELRPEMFGGYDLLHIEGYLVQDPDLIRTAVCMARNAGLRISLDLASYNVVEAHRDFFGELIRDYVDIVFANEEEALAYTGKVPAEAVRVLSEACDIAVVKCGADGSLVRQGKRQIRIEAIPARCIDTTGAGDLYAAGCL